MDNFSHTLTIQIAISCEEHDVSVISSDISAAVQAKIDSYRPENIGSVSISKALRANIDIDKDK